MRFIVSIMLFCFTYSNLFSQKVFTLNEEKYNMGFIVHQYLYNIIYKDSFNVKLIDSTLIYSTADSMVNTTINFPMGDITIYRTNNYFNKYRKLIKSEELKNNVIENEMRWIYDEKTNKKLAYIVDNKKKGEIRKETYEYSYDKINGDLICFVSQYLNDKIEYYTKEYFDKVMKKYKEVRLNDNKKDVMHTENFIYGENGRIKERSIYFNEFKVTKNFTEPEGLVPAKCYKLFPLTLSEKITNANKVIIIRNFLKRNKELIFDKECSNFEYKFRSPVYEIILKTERKSLEKQVRISIVEKPN